MKDDAIYANRRLLAIRRSGSPIGNNFHHRTMVHDGGIYHAKNNNNIRRVYVLVLAFPSTVLLRLLAHVLIHYDIISNWECHTKRIKLIIYELI